MLRSELLISAKDFLATDEGQTKQRFICLAIEDAISYQNLRDVSKQHDDIFYYIDDALGGFTVRAWLRREVHTVTTKDLSDKNIQAYRHRWLDHIIKLYQEKEANENQHQHR